MDAVFKGHNLFVATPKSGDFPDLQFYYDVCLPGNSTILNKYDAVTMRLRDNSLNVRDCEFFPTIEVRRSGVNHFNCATIGLI